MPYKDKAKQKEYLAKYYQTKIRPFRNKQKWNSSKRAWVKCVLCGKVGHFKPINPHEPEVFSMIYGGRGCIQKIGEAELMRDIPQIIKPIKENYIADIKRACWRFIQCYSTEKELKEMLESLGVSIGTGMSKGAVIELPPEMVVPMSNDIFTDYEIATSVGWED